MIDIKIGDCLEQMQDLPDNSVQCCITSPPYYRLRDYGVEGQLGLESSIEEYINKQVEVFREVRRLLRNDGTLWLNIGDSYASSQMADDKKYGNEEFNKNRPCREQCKVPARTVPAGVKRGDLMGIPWRLALALQADGWYLRSDIIWNKPNCMPESVKNRPTKAHEYVFLFSKCERYFYDYVAIQEPVLDSSINRYRYTMTSSTPGKAYPNEKRDSPCHLNHLDETNTHKNKRSVWNIPTRAFKGSHFATFPLKLVEPCLQAGTSEKGCCPECGAPYQRIVNKEFVPQEDVRDPAKLAKAGNKGLDESNGWGESPRGTNKTTTLGWEQSCTCTAGDPVPCTALDPFAGSGTVGEWCRCNGRDCILIELNPEYAKLIKERTMANIPELSQFVAGE